MMSKIFLDLFQLAIIVVFLSVSTQAQNGVVKSFYPNKTIKSEISYINDILDGKSIYYYSNGNIQEEKNYSKGILNGWVRQYYESGKIKIEYYVDNGVKDGDEKKYSSEGELISILTYQKGYLKRKQTFDGKFPIAKESNKKVDIKENYKEAYPIGGVQEIESKIIYPEDAKKYGLEGSVVLNLKIDETGNVLNYQVKKSLGLGCDEEAIRILKETKFIPARNNDKFIPSELELEIKFRLPKKEEKIVQKENQQLSTAISTSGKNIEIICQADQCPRPEDALATIYSRVQIPNVAKALKIKGVIVIEGIVTIDGQLKQTKIVSGVGYGCDQIIESSLKLSKFSPALKNQKPIEAKVIINFPLNYDLE